MPENLSAGQLYPAPSQTYGWIGGGAAANTTSVTPGATGNDQYWLPVWSGEVLNAYDQYNIFEPMVTTQTIESGTTKRFPVTGTVGHKGVWKAGEELLGDSTATAAGFFDISLDQRPMASFFELDDISLMITQWDYRSELARQAGLQLSYIRDKQIASMIALGSVTAARNPFSSSYQGMCVDETILPAANAFNMLGLRGASATERADAALLLLDYLERYMVRLSEIDATLTGVYCAVTPQAFHDIRALGIARDSTGLVGGAGRPFFGGVAEAGGLGSPLSKSMFNLPDTLEYMGVKIVKSNHLQQLDHQRVISDDGTGGANTPQGAVSATTGRIAGGINVGLTKDLGDAKYNFNWYDGTNTVSSVSPVTGAGLAVQGATLKPVKALIWQQSAICSLRLQGMKVETVKDVRRGTFFTVASIMGGAGVLRPELCATIRGSYPAA
jgi:hypothetical protein